MELLDLKIFLLCHGVDMGAAAFERGRRGGAGPAGTCFEVDGILVNTLMNMGSAFKLERDGEARVTYSGTSYPLRMIPRPQYYDSKTSDGIPMRKIALLHGRDCLATTLYQKCTLMDQGLGCGFCAIETTLKDGLTVLKKTPLQLEEVVIEALKDGISHITITTGTPNTEDHGAGMLASAVGHLKERFDLPIHVQLTPSHRKHLELLHNAGADTIGIHVETFDKKVMKQVCPGKIDFDYKTALECAVNIFGENQVSSFVLGGLGEKPETMKKGFDDLAALGVIPFLVPFRPLPGAKLQERPPPDPQYMKDLYVKLAEALTRYGVDIEKNLAGCVKCGACSAIDVALKAK